MEAEAHEPLNVHEVEVVEGAVAALREQIQERPGARRSSEHGRAHPQLVVRPRHEASLHADVVTVVIVGVVLGIGRTGSATLRRHRLVHGPWLRDQVVGDLVRARKKAFDVETVRGNGAASRT